MPLPRIVRHLPVALLLLGASACTTLSPARTDATAPCRQFFAQLDADVERAGARDAGATVVPGYPYLRADRFLASFAGEVDADGAFAAWTARMRALDLLARDVELQRVDGESAARRLDQARRCGEQLSALELQTDAQRQHLRQHVRVPDDYALGARGIGLYPFAVPFLNRGIADYHDEVHADFARPLGDLHGPGPLIAWAASAAAASAAPDPAGDLASAPRDALGVPQIDTALQRRLALRHAPVWWVETGGDYDRPGWPAQGPAGPTVDASRPVVHYRLDYTRFGTQVLPALSYIVWFSERPAQSSFDPYAGRLDGLVWRVVLDPDGRPLSYDTIHPCGCYRYVFPAQPLARAHRGGFWQEPVLYPQDDVPAEPLALRVQSQTHYLRRVVAIGDVVGERRTYELRPYDELLRTVEPAQRLFGADGLVAGSERLERWWLWITGVPDPGAMRQWGRHATSFVGRSHFDDARFLEQQYVVPDRAR